MPIRTLARQHIPTLDHAEHVATDVAQRVRRSASRCRAAVQAAYQPQVIDGTSAVGGGALPLAPLPTKLLALRPTFCSVTALERRLRCRHPAIIGRIAQDQYLLDLRRCWSARSRNCYGLATSGTTVYETDCLRHRRPY